MGETNIYWIHLSYLAGILLSFAEFIGPWKKKFGYYSTRRGHFFLNENDRVSIEMMNHDDYFYYASLPDLDAAGVMLPLEVWPLFSSIN